MRIAIEKNKEVILIFQKILNPKKTFFARLMYVLLYILYLKKKKKKLKSLTEYDMQFRVCQGMQGKCANKAN